MFESKVDQPVAPYHCKILAAPFSASLLRSLSIALATISFSINAPPAWAEAPCETIRFEAGASSTKISGSVDPDATMCFSFAARNGQTVRIVIQSKDKNTIFSIPGLIDAQSKYEFKSEKKTYEIIIGQLMKSATADTYQLTVTIK